MCGVLDGGEAWCGVGDGGKLRGGAEEVWSDDVVAARSWIDQRSALHVACEYGKEEVAVQLIEW